MKLVIIGNGFDRANDLKTSYNDFFDHSESKFGDFFRELETLTDSDFESGLSELYDKCQESTQFTVMGVDSKKNERITTMQRMYDDEKISSISTLRKKTLKLKEKYDGICFWNAFFHFEKNLDTKREVMWSDVEMQMFDYVTNKGFDLYTKSSFNDLKAHAPSYNNYFKFPITEIHHDNSRSSNEGFSSYFSNVFSSNDDGSMKKLLLHLCFFYDNQENSSFEELLLDELSKFEEQFSAYIRELQTNIIDRDKQSNHSYFENLIKLVGKNETKAFLLNFNYTYFSNSYCEDYLEAKPYDYIVSGDRFIKDYSDPLNSEFLLCSTNVHGICDDKNIIFGVDHDTFNSNSPVYVFTKTYRKLIQSISRNIQMPLPLPEDIKEIVIYGHSLSAADHSYFQSIFDFYNIYETQVKVTFLYSDYSSEENGLSSLNIQRKYVKSVTELLGKYGKSTGNEHRGKNLVHKLQLEGRLSVREVELNSFI